MTGNDLMRRKKKKRGRKNKNVFGSCFRSFPNTPSSYNDHSNDRDVKNSNKPVLVGVSGCKGKFVLDDVNIVNVNVDCGVKRSNHRRSFSRVMKAVFFDTLMTKKINRSSSKSSVASDTSTSYSGLSSEKIIKSSNGNKAFSNECTDMDDSCSCHSSSNLLSSSSSRTTCSSYSTSSCSSNNSINAQSSCDSKPSSQIESCVSLPIAKLKPSNTISRLQSYQKGLLQLDTLELISSALSSPDKTKPSSKNWNIKWCLFLLLSLIVLVMYGRIFSILCTSTWFYFVPCRKMKRVKSVTNVTKVLDTDSEQYKKRVIMTGLLDRTRNPIR